MYNKRDKYLVKSDHWITDRTGFGNFKVFTCKKAAVRFFMKNPFRGQIEFRPYNGEDYCMMYWEKGKIIHQPKPKKKFIKKPHHMANRFVYCEHCGTDTLRDKAGKCTGDYDWDDYIGCEGDRK